MNRISKTLALMAMFSTFVVIKPAAATLSALISIHEGSADMWEQRASIQDLLRNRFNFDDVRFLVDATAEEVPEIMKRFLEQKAGPDDRRLVWVSGFNQRQNGTVCANRKFQTINPKATSLILVPGCYTDIISLPQGTRHFSITTPTPANSTARIGRTRATNAPWIAVLTLPSANGMIIRNTNALILKHLNSASNNRLDPAVLLHYLRLRFRWNGSDFTPSLDLFDRGFPHEGLRPFGISPTQTSRAIHIGGSPARPLTPVFGLYAKPDARDGLVMSAQPNTKIRILRRNRDGQMRYVAIDNSLFGWMKSDDLDQ